MLPKHLKSGLKFVEFELFFGQRSRVRDFFPSFQGDIFDSAGVFALNSRHAIYET
jgi:hypothetical protein